MVAGGVGEGDGYGGYREPPGRDAPAARASATSRVLRAVRHGAAAPVRARERAAPGLRRRGAADRRRPDDLAAVGAGPLPRAARRSRGRERVLEVGAGSGYQTALLALPGRRGVQRGADRLRWPRARGRRSRPPGIRNVTVLVGDGTLGWRPFAPYDAILVAAASPEIPAPLVEQLAPGGRLVIPLGDRAQPGR